MSSPSGLAQSRCADFSYRTLPFVTLNFPDSLWGFYVTSKHQLCPCEGMKSLPLPREPQGTFPNPFRWWGFVFVFSHKKWFMLAKVKFLFNNISYLKATRGAGGKTQQVKMLLASKSDHLSSNPQCTHACTHNSYINFEGKSPNPVVIVSRVHSHGTFLLSSVACTS